MIWAICLIIRWILQWFNMIIVVDINWIIITADDVDT